MNILKENKIKVLIICTFYILCFSTHHILQNQSIYQNSLGFIAKNYENKDGDIRLIKKPYDKISNAKLLHWDAALYQNIKNNRYDIKKSGGDYIFAFFPLFPIIWKVTNLNALRISIFNMLIFAVSFIIISKLFQNTKKSNLIEFTLGLISPMIVIFFIPYSESIFMLFLTFAFAGILKNKYWMYFLGIFFASMARPAALILLLTFICTDFIHFLNHRNTKTFIRECIYKIIPIILGTLSVSLIQMQYDSGSILKFIEVQSYWGHKLSFPTQIRDWSHEQFGINISIIFYLIPISLIYIVFIIYNSFKKENNTILSSINSKEYLFILSLIYIVGMFLFVLFFRGGSLHCLARFTLCTPFFYIVLFHGCKKVITFNKKKINLFYIALIILSIMYLSFASYGSKWNFSDLGYILFTIMVGLWLYQQHFRKKIYQAVLIIYILFGILWTTYLFNTFLANGWIFA